ncbi:MAG: hypothetical protein WD716_11010 [Fimbriimonadaceae bacterium]
MARYRENGERKTGAVVWTALAILGVAAITFVIARKAMRGEDILDADAILDAAETAAANLDAILMAESQVAS